MPNIWPNISPLTDGNISLLILNGIILVHLGYHAQADAQFVMDAYGRFLPTEDRFPSAIDGRGFKTLADYLHEKGLKFGFHIM